MADAPISPDVAGSTSTPVSPPTTSKAAAPNKAEALVAKSDAEGTPEPKAPAAPEPPAKRKYKMKVDGQELEEELSDDEISVRLQKERASDKRFQEAAALKQKFGDVVKWIKENPFEALKDPVFGLDLDKLAEERLASKYKQIVEDEQLTPEQKKEREYQKKIDAAEARAQKLENDAQTRAQEEINQKVYKETEDLFGQVLEQEGVEKSYETMYHLASIAKMLHANGMPLDPKILAAELRGRLDNSRTGLEKSVRGGLKGDKLLTYLGDDTVKEVLRAAVARAQGSNAAKIFPPKEAPAAVDPDGKDSKYVKEKTAGSYREFQKYIRG